MGEAKRLRAHKASQMAEALRVELARLMVPPSASEARLLAEIEEMDFYKVQRASDHVLTYGNMKPQQCHTNAGEYARLDPEKETQHVSGWWKRGDIFYFHSVVLRQTKLFCVTPHADGSALEFAPDFDITWHDAGDRWRSARGGGEVPYLVRRDPLEVIDICTSALAQLDAGVDPFTIRIPL